VSMKRRGIIVLVTPRSWLAAGRIRFRADGEGKTRADLVALRIRRESDGRGYRGRACSKGGERCNQR
jgi:hypothetical protein